MNQIMCLKRFLHHGTLLYSTLLYFRYFFLACFSSSLPRVPSRKDNDEFIGPSPPLTPNMKSTTKASINSSVICNSSSRYRLTRHGKNAETSPTHDQHRRANNRTHPSKLTLTRCVTLPPYSPTTTRNVCSSSSSSNGKCFESIHSVKR